MTTRKGLKKCKERFEEMASKNNEVCRDGIDRDETHGLIERY